MSTEKLEPILEGYLKKQSPKGLLVKPWQERYFVLQPNGEILYYASHQSMSDVTGRIKLRTITEISISSKKAGGCVIEIQALKKGSPRTYLLQANNSSDARMWLETIEDVRRKCEESDKNALRPKADKMSITFQCPGGNFFCSLEVEAGENMYEVKASLFAKAKKAGHPIAGVPEDYLIMLQSPEPAAQPFFLEDTRGELGQSLAFTKAFAEGQLWMAAVKPLSEMSELKQQLEKQRSTSQEIEILVGKSSSTSSADSLYLSEVIRHRSRSSSQEKGTWSLPIAETAPFNWGPRIIDVHCYLPDSHLKKMALGVSALDTAVEIRDTICRTYAATTNEKLRPDRFALKLGGWNVYADTRDGSTAKMGDYKIVQQLAVADGAVLVKLVEVPPEPVGDGESSAPPQDMTIPDLVPPSLFVPWTEWQAIPSTLVKLQFKVKVGEVLISSAETQLKKLGTRDNLGSMYITAGLYYGGETLTHECLLQTSSTCGCATPQWNEWLIFPLQIGSLPQATRLCFSIFYREPTSSSSPKDTPLGWVNLQLMDQKGIIISGRKRLRLWPDGPANAIGTCIDNSGSDSPGALYVQFDESPLPNVFSQESGRVAPEPVEAPITEGRKASASIFGASPFAPNYGEPQLRAEESLRLQEALRADVLTLPTDEERRILWKARSSLKSNARALGKVIHSVPWSNRKAVFEARRLLADWAAPTPLAALQLLNAQFADPEVRKYAVSRLRELDDIQLQNYVLQLVQVLKYEAYHNSEVAQFLLERAVGNRTIGHQLFWHLQAELHVPTIKDRYSLILSAYLRCCGSSYRKEFLKQTELVKKLCAVADAIKVVKGENERMAVIRKMLGEIRFPDKVILPLDPRFEVSGLIVEKCKFMDSKKLPLWLVFQNADPQGAPIYVIFKSGDDLRQDMLTLQMIRIMDKLWQRNGLDLGLNAYSCMATGDEMGMLQVVLNAETTSAISKAAGGSSACFREDPVANWIRQHNPTPEKYAKAVENFTRSCAGYCIATCVLGIGDRHNDNIMMQRTGYLFHIDFGHFLGNFKSKFGFRRERAKFVLTPDFAFVMGGVGDERFKRFEQLCAQAFNVLRKEADLFINLFALMLSSGIPELQSPDDIHYLRDSFLLDLSDEEAGKEFVKWIHESLNTRSTQINNAIHTWAHS